MVSDSSLRIGRQLGTLALGLGIAAVLLAAPAAAAPVPFELGKPELNKDKGTATLAVEVPEKGKVSVSTAKTVQQLKNTGKLKAKFTVTFAPQGPPTPSGGPSAKVLTITLRLEH